VTQAKLSFYLDESLPTEIASQLKRLNISVVTVRDLNTLGDSDSSHLQRASAMGLVLCSNDADFLELAFDEQARHCGVVVGRPALHTIGDWVHWMVLMHDVYTPEDMVNRVEFVKKPS